MRSGGLAGRGDLRRISGRAAPATPSAQAARRASYSAPEWLPLRSPARVGFVQTNCSGPYHGYWAIDFLDHERRTGDPCSSPVTGRRPSRLPASFFQLVETALSRRVSLRTTATTAPHPISRVRHPEPQAFIRILVLKAQTPLRLAREVRDPRRGPPGDGHLHPQLLPPAPQRPQLQDAARSRGHLKN